MKDGAEYTARLGDLGKVADDPPELGAGRSSQPHALPKALDDARDARCKGGLAMRIYCDTNCLPHNIRGKKCQGELEALEHLARRFELYGSRFVRQEALNTKDESLRDFLIVECGALKPVPKDEKLLGFHSHFDRFGGFCCPMIADTHDDVLCEELKKHGLEPKDAQHITQAVCNDCDVFLTRDEKSIINPHGQWLETRLHPLKVWMPSTLLKALEGRWPDAAA